EHDPIGAEPIPRTGAIERAADDREQLALDARIVEEAAPGARVHDPRALTDDAESAAGDIAVAAEHDDGARAHVLLLADHRRDAAAPKVLKRLGGMLEVALACGRLRRRHRRRE